MKKSVLIVAVETRGVCPDMYGSEAIPISLIEV